MSSSIKADCVHHGLTVLLQGRLLAFLTVPEQLRLKVVNKHLHNLVAERVSAHPTKIVNCSDEVAWIVDANDVYTQRCYSLTDDLDSDEDEDEIYWEALQADQPEFTKHWEDVIKSRIDTQTSGHGVHIADEPVLSEPERLRLMSLIDRLRDSHKVPDYHPFSNNTVLDIVHPALYCYVRDESIFIPSNLLAVNAALTIEASRKLQGLQPEIPTSRTDTTDAPSLVASSAADHTENSAELDPKPVDRDMWGREFETSKYQWLPTYFSVDGDCQTTIEDYINGIPRNGNEDFYDALARLFKRALPFLEQAWTYCKHAKFASQTEDWNWGDETAEIDDMVAFESLRGRRLQVITKIVDYTLEPGQTYEGVWHVEGMSHECIVATSVYVIDRDPALQGGDLRFKRAFTTTETSRLAWNIAQERVGAVSSFLDAGLLPLGSIDTPHGRLVTFPNSHVHKVSALTNTGSTPARRRIVVFFLVNPEIRIPSTKEVPDQRDHITLEQAKAHRLELMRGRKFHKQDFNVRELNLCEH